MLRQFFFATILFLFPTIIFAQQDVLLGNLKLESDVYGAKIYKHTPKFKPNTNQLVGGFEIKLLRQTFGSKEWHQSYHFPLCGVQFIYANFNDKNLGESFALMPLVQFNFLKRKNFTAYFGVADGLAYFTKKYDRLTDSINNVIGSTINEATQFKFGATCQIQNSGLLTATFSFTHYSNAKFTTPNLGINVYALHLGFQNFISHTPANFRTVAIPNYSRKLKLDVRLGYARNGNVIGGPKDPYYTVYLGIDKRWCYKNRWQFGLWYQYDKGVHDAMNFYETRSDIATFTNKVGLIFGDEFIFGKMSFGGSFGYYLYNGQNGAGIFQNLHINYILWSWNQEKMLQIYCGVKLKTYLGQAEYFETYIGWRL